jgi:hypothetical protein
VEMPPRSPRVAALLRCSDSGGETSGRGLVIDLCVVAQREQVVLGGHDLRIAQALGDLGQRVALLGEQRPSALAEAMRREVRRTSGAVRRG